MMTQSIKVATYNIMSGGFHDYDNKIPFPKRLPTIRKVVNFIDVDFITLIDTFRWETYFKLEEIRNKFDYPYVYCINLQDPSLEKRGHNNGITILSRLPANFETIRIGTRNAIKSTILSDHKFIIFSVYLDHAKESTRLAQANDLINLTSTHENSIIMGYLNSFSPKKVAVYDQTVTKLYKNHPNVVPVIKPMINEMLKAKTIPYLLSHDYVDSGLGAEPTAPTKLLLGLEPIFRIDYILHKKNLKSNKFEVINTNLSQNASDHLPITCNIHLS